MKTIWWEIWGVEKGEQPPAILLMKIPEDSLSGNVEEDILEVVRGFKADGATDLELRRVDEE